MYAIVRSGGKEYRVSKGDIIRLEKLDAKVGDSVTLNEVMMVADGGDVRVGAPLLPNVAVTGQIIQESKAKKVLTYKMKRRKNYRRFKGHRQTYTSLRVDEITLS